MKHIKSIILTLQTTLLALPISAQDFEFEGILYTVLDAEAKTCKTKENWYRYTDGIDDAIFTDDFEIPSIVSDGFNNYTVVEIGYSTFEDCQAIISIKLPETLKVIGHSAFSGCSNLAYVGLSDGLESIERYAFASCQSLTSVFVPASVVEMQEYVFHNCMALAKVVLPESLTVIPFEMFYGCSSLSEVNFPESLDIIRSSAFWECRSLTSVKLPESLRIIEDGAFYGCSSLTELILPKSLTEIGERAFQRCDIRVINLPGTIDLIGSAAFEYNQNIEEITYEAVNPIEAPIDIFNNNIPNTFNEAILKTPNASLADVLSVLPWYCFDRIKAKDGSVGFAEAGTDFEYKGVWYTVLDAEAQTCRTKAGEDSFSSGNNVTGDIVIPSIAVGEDIEYSVVEIGDYSFMSNQDLKSIQLPESITSIGTYAFENCINLSSINIPDSVSSIGSYAFANCWILNSIHIPESLTSIEDGLFYYCLELTSINIPMNVAYIGNSAFEVCPKITCIDIPESVTSIGDMAFYDCNDLTSISLPEGLLTIGKRVFNSGLDYSDTETVNYYASIPLSADRELFIDSVYNVATLHMPNALLSDIKAAIPWNLFKHIVAKDGYEGFGDLILAGEEFEYEGIWYKVLDVENRTCSVLAPYIRGEAQIAQENYTIIPENVYYKDAVFTVTELGEYAFYGVENLVSITLPKTIDKIGNNALANCPLLSSLMWHGNERLNVEVVKSIGNPNLLVYVDDKQYAPDGLDHNVVANGVCDRLVLTPGYPFTPVADFTAKTSIMKKEFLQATAYDGCAGWETIVVPFDVTRVSSPEGHVLLPFAAVSDVNSQRPFWLYEADPEGEWMEAAEIKAGVPYIISMPNNPRYNPAYNIHGTVTFSNSTSQKITTETTTPYVATWATGREFRSLWLPLDKAEAEDAMGLNVGMDNLTDDNGTVLAPGSAFHTDVLPKPLEAYVLRNDNANAFRIHGLQSAVLALPDEDGLKIAQEGNGVILKSSVDRTIDVYSADGTLLRRVSLKAGEPVYVDNLPKGVCLIAGHKVMIKH